MDGDRKDYWPALHRGYGKFKRLTKSPNNQNSARKYFKFLTIEAERSITAAEMVDKNDVAKERLEWLNGPNAEVFYKIWKIRNG